MSKLKIIHVRNMKYDVTILIFYVVNSSSSEVRSILKPSNIKDILSSALCFAQRNGNLYDQAVLSTTTQYIDPCITIPFSQSVQHITPSQVALSFGDVLTKRSYRKLVIIQFETSFNYGSQKLTEFNSRSGDCNF